MADAGVIDLDTGSVVEKRGRGRPRASKNKPKDVSMVASSLMSTHASVLVDSVGPPGAEVCRTAASFP
jgi:hypothetical protein